MQAKLARECAPMTVNGVAIRSQDVYMLKAEGVMLFFDIGTLRLTDCIRIL